jgi:ABC-type Fe3+-citrate transport system substrate-binding protein
MTRFAGAFIVSIICTSCTSEARLREHDERIANLQQRLEAAEQELEVRRASAESSRSCPQCTHWESFVKVLLGDMEKYGILKGCTYGK